MIDDHYGVVFWDFDGVLMASNEIRDIGFRRVLEAYPDEDIEALMAFHQRNGGLSRYVKFRYFFEEVRGRSVTNDEIDTWAARFSKVMLELLVDSDLLIEETLQYVREWQAEKRMHVVSGSDQQELRHICAELNIDQYFDSIHGSPTPKTEWVGTLINQYGYDRNECILIGDSINDHESAVDNGIDFLGYGNENIKEYTTSEQDFTQEDEA